MAKIEPVIFKAKNGAMINIRSLEGCNAETVLKFRQQFSSETKNTLHYVGMKFPPIEEMAKRIDAQLTSETALNIGAFDGDKLVGHLGFQVPRQDHPWAAHLGEFGMGILKSHWALGIGKKMLQIQDEHAKRIGVVRIEAKVRTKNERGIALYKSCGFEIEGTARKAAFIDNEYVDEHFIAKILDEKGTVT